MEWHQVYNPLHNVWLSTISAGLPIFVLLGGLAIFRLKAHTAALLSLLSALATAVFVFSMPVGHAAKTALFGAAYGLFPIGWIILTVIFLYQLTLEKGYFQAFYFIEQLLHSSFLSLSWSMKIFKRTL